LRIGEILSKSCVTRSRRHFQVSTRSIWTLHKHTLPRALSRRIWASIRATPATLCHMQQPYTMLWRLNHHSHAQHPSTPTKAMLTALWSSICAAPATLCPHTPINLATLCHGYDTRSLSFVLFSSFCFHPGHEDVALCCSCGGSCHRDGMSS
jgi:hypothetical protein